MFGFPKYVSGSAKQAANIAREMTAVSARVSELIGEGRQFVIGMDCWSKKVLTASFLGISDTFFHPVFKVSLTFILNSYQILRPHTGEVIADKLHNCLYQCGIDPKNVLMLVTDNGSNMIKAVRIAMFGDTDNDLSDESDGEEEEDEEDQTAESGITLHRFRCLAHSLQLVMKEVEISAVYSKLLTKTKALVGKIRISSAATEKLIAKCVKTVVTECSTKWNSNMYMIERLLNIKDAVTETLNEMTVDGLLAMSGRSSKISTILSSLSQNIQIRCGQIALPF